MKKTLLSLFKIYFGLMIYLILALNIYAIYIYFGKNNTNQIINLIILALLYFLIGLFYANWINKKGILVGLITGILHYLIFYLIKILSIETTSFNLILIIIISICSTIGGIIGVNMKKIF